MRVELFGVGVKGKSPAISAQRRINCYCEEQQDNDRARMVLIGCPGLTLFNVPLSGPSRGMWPVNSLAMPLLFTVHGATLYSVNNAGIASIIGTIGTTSGNVSMVDDGTYLMLVDGVRGYYYNMITPAGLVTIVDGNFTTTPTTVTWQDTFFIVNAGGNNQFQLNDGVTPATWPAVNINFSGAAPGALVALIGDHSVLNLYGGDFAEFWQNAGFSGFPYAKIPASAKEYGLASAWSLAKYDNSLAGLFKNRMGEVNVSRMSGFDLQQISNLEVDYLINSYSNVANATGYGYLNGGHPMYQINFPSADRTWEYDGATKVWGERQATDGGRYWGNKFAVFVNRKLVSDYRNGSIYEIDDSVYTDNGSVMPMEVWTRHIWEDDKYLSIVQLQVDIESGVGLATGQGSDPQIMLEISKDGGQTFRAEAWASMGAIGEYTQRVIWRRLGRARDWVLKLRITDPVKRIITGASAQIIGGSF